MTFSEKCLSCYILLTDQFSLPDCLYFSRYRAISVLKLFVNQAVTSLNLNWAFLIKPICYMTKKSRQKLKYLENKKSFWSEIKSLFHHFKGLSVVKIVSDLRVRLWFLQQSFTSHHIIPTSNYCVFIVNFEHISYFVLVLLSLTLTRQIPAGNMINLILHHSPQTLVLLNLANA